MASLHVHCIVAAAVLCLSPALAFAQDVVPPPPPPGDAAAAPPPDAPPPAAPPPAAPAAPAKSDEPDPKTLPAANSVFAEGLGAGLWYSINYERRIIPDVGVRVGFSYVSYGASISGPGTSASASVSALTFPITASYLGIRGGKHALELGGGASLSYVTGSAASGGVGASASGLTAFGTLMVGYRLHPVGGAGFQFRIGAMALMGKGFNVFGDNIADFGVMPFGYISFGAGF
jgi:hypothetical protein